jgi:NADP-dependent 3-hydroxy acid dehydrogenase YdfG
MNHSPHIVGKQVMTAKTALVTGVSSGIGEATARNVQALGFSSYGAARRLERMQELAADGILTLAMDVLADAFMRACIERIVPGPAVPDSV